MEKENRKNEICRVSDTGDEKTVYPEIKKTACGKKAFYTEQERKHFQEYLRSGRLADPNENMKVIHRRPMLEKEGVNKMKTLKAPKNKDFKDVNKVCGKPAAICG